MSKLKFTREDIIRRASVDLNLPYHDMNLVLNSFLGVLTDMLIEEKSNIRIELRNFGIFEVKPTKAKPRARNPRTNIEFYVPSRRKVSFKPGKIIKEVLQKEWIE